MKERIFLQFSSISLDNHNWIPTTDNRLLRRIIRDYRFRGYSARDTIARWPSVRRGEDKWIFPYQENADAMFNSAMLYELAALRKEAEPILGEVRECDPENAEAYRLLRFLRYFNYIPDVGLPGTSLLREFLGGGSFQNQDIRFRSSSDRRPVQNQRRSSPLHPCIHTCSLPRHTYRRTVPLLFCAPVLRLPVP